MQRTKLRELLVSGGIENPSTDLIGALLDAFNEEKETMKADYEQKITDANKKVEEAEANLKTATEGQIKKEDYDKLLQENEANKATIVKAKKQEVLSKYKIDKDFYDAVIGKIDAGKDDAEFDANVKAFAENKDNAKYLVRTVVIDSNPNLQGGTPAPKTDINSAIREYYGKGQE